MTNRKKNTDTGRAAIPVMAPAGLKRSLSLPDGTTSPESMVRRELAEERPPGRATRAAALVIILALLLLPGIAAAGEFEGGIPLRTVKSGVVSGGLWYDTYPGYDQWSAYKSFPVPSHSSVEWARLYVGVYCGHKQNNYPGTATISLDKDGDGKGDYLLGNEELNVPYTYPGNQGTGPVYLPHGTRVTSDYIFSYDIADQLTDKAIGVEVKTAKATPSSSFDGHIKFMALVVAYNDGDNDKIYYWVNEGHDPLNTNVNANEKGTTEFATSRIDAAEDREFTATLSSLYMASKNGGYSFNTEDLMENGAPQGQYFGTESWDVTDLISFDEDSELQYWPGDGATYFKIPLALLTVAFRQRPEGTLEITSSPVGAQILLDEEEIGKTTNQTLTEIPAGDHTVQVLLVDNEKYREPEQRTVAVRNGETTKVHFDIPPVNGSIDIMSEPDGAWIFLDGKNTSLMTDTLMEDVIIGDHTIVLKKAGYTDVNASLMLEEDQTESVDLSFGDPVGSVTAGSLNVTTDAANMTTGNGYAGKPLSLYSHGSVRGSLEVRDAGGYSGLLGKGMSASYPVAVSVPPNATVKDARLYVYTTWSHDADTLAGIPSSLEVEMNGEKLAGSQTYSDRKGKGTYDYPVETHCFTPEGIQPGNQTLSLTITNTGNSPDKVAVYGVMLVTVNEDPGGREIEYWIAEGSDAVYANPEFQVGTDEAESGIAFPGPLTMTAIAQGELYAVTTAASGDGNRITFNGRQWEDSLNGGSSSITISRLNVSTQVRASGNRAGIGSVNRNGKGDYLENRNLILVVTKADSGGIPLGMNAPVEGGDDTGSGGEGPDDITSTVNLTNPSLLATGPQEEYLDQEGKTYAIRVISNPAGALISVDYRYCGKATPDTVDGLAAGNHTVSVEMPGFDPVEERILLTTNQTMTFDLATRGTSVLSQEKVDGSHQDLLDQEKYGGVYVTSSPEPAFVYIDGKKTGFSTPAVLYGLKEGKHTVQVKLAKVKGSSGTEAIKFPIEKKEVWVEDGVITPVSILHYENPYLSKPAINSTAFRNSTFTLNGNLHTYRMGEGVQLQASQNYITIQQDNAYISYTIFTDNTSAPRIEPRKYTLNNVWVESDPPGADIFVDGFATGLTTPYLVRNLSDQEHRIMISKPGYYPLENTVHITGVDLVRRFVLEPYLNGMLSVTSVPPGGKIYINGKETGKKTPYTFQYMEVGKYTVKVSLNQTQATYEGFMVEPNIISELNLTLKKK